MSEYVCLLLTLLQKPVGDFGSSLLRVAVKIHRDDEQAFLQDPKSFLPEHCRNYEILDEETIQLLEIVSVSKRLPSVTDLPGQQHLFQRGVE